MAHYLLSAEATFSAAHTLPESGVCEQLHGHNWRIQLTVRVHEAKLNAQGMGIDFRTIDDIVHSAVAEFDHAYLNDLEPFRSTPPTAEMIAREVYERARTHLARASSAAKVAEVAVWEMPGYRAVYRPE